MQRERAVFVGLLHEVVPHGALDVPALDPERVLLHDLVELRLALLNGESLEGRVLRRVTA